MPTSVNRNGPKEKKEWMKILREDVAPTNFKFPALEVVRYTYSPCSSSHCLGWRPKGPNTGFEGFVLNEMHNILFLVPKCVGRSAQPSG